MGFKRENTLLILLTVLLIISAAGLGWALTTAYFHLAIILGLLVIFLAYMLFRSYSLTLRELLFFFKALENDETSIRYTARRQSRMIDELGDHLNGLNDSFKQMKIDHEQREIYFMQILEHISGGLLVLTKTGHVNHINPQALGYFELSTLRHIRSLEAKNAKLYTMIREIKPGKKGEISLDSTDKRRSMLLGMQCTGLNLRGEELRIISIQDLSVEMEQKEIDDWIRLIRIMSHEIMNSLAPITSISTTLKELWTEEHEADAPSGKNITQTIKGLDAIAEQSEGLTTFFESYRVLSRIPDPEIKEFPLCPLLEKVETLVRHNHENQHISFSFTCDEYTTHIHADEQMIIQVLLNLVKNAAQALDGIKDARIDVSARKDENGIQLFVRDNGPGIPEEIARDIWLPFFTTREKGTGVGLSYSRQVMNLNGGSIDFESREGHTVFRLSFPQSMYI